MKHEKRREKHQSSESSGEVSSDSKGRHPHSEAYELYKRKKRERQLEQERIATAKLSWIDTEQKPRKLSFQDFPNFKRKLVVQGIPLSQSTDDIMAYFFSILASLAHERGEKYNKNPLMSVQRYEGLRFVTLEFRKRDDAEICLDLDGTEFSAGNQMRIMRVKRFIDKWNEDVEKGVTQNTSNFSLARDNANTIQVDKKILTTQDGRVVTTDAKGEEEEDNRVFMGGIPFTMNELTVREMVESFGKLKSFNLIKENADQNLNKGYAFFEYVDERAAEKAIKTLNNMEIMDKKLKV